MPKLYLKQKVFSWKDRAVVKNEAEEDCYFIEGKILSIGKKLHITNKYDEEVAQIHQKVLSLLPKFYIYVNDNQVAEVKKKFTLLRQRYVIDGLGWEVNGDFMDHEYTISKQDREIVRIHKAWFSWGDSYELTISEGVDEVMALAVALAIDCVLDAQEMASE